MSVAIWTNLSDMWMSFLPVENQLRVVNQGEQGWRSGESAHSVSGWHIGEREYRIINDDSTI